MFLHALLNNKDHFFVCKINILMKRTNKFTGAVKLAFLREKRVFNEAVLMKITSFNIYSVV